MKKLSVFLSLLFVLVFAVTVSAQSSWPDRSQPKAKSSTVSKDVTAAPASNFVFGLNNLSGDFGLVYERNINGSLAVGIGLDILSYKQGLVVFRLEGFFPGVSVLNQQDATIIGAAALVNLIQLVGQVPGTTWLAKTINPSLGITLGYDVNTKEIAFVPMVSIINIQW